MHAQMIRIEGKPEISFGDPLVQGYQKKKKKKKNRTIYFRINYNLSKRKPLRKHAYSNILKS